MSGKIVGEVLNYAPADLTVTQRFVLVALAESVRDHPATHPRHRVTKTNAREVSDQTTIAYGTVRNALSELARRSLIQPLGKVAKGHAQDYRIAQLEAHHRAATMSSRSDTMHADDATQRVIPE